VKGYFITGIGTGVGKTVVSAVLVKALKAEYWKPVQCGELDFTDSHQIETIASNPNLIIHSETYRLKEPMSPHAAAKMEGVTIEIDSIVAPSTENTLIIEGAGGLLVPLNDNDLMVDLIQQLGFPVILVVRNYLGSINHSLLSIELLSQQCKDVNDREYSPTMKQLRLNTFFHLHHTGTPLLPSLLVCEVWRFSFGCRDAKHIYCLFQSGSQFLKLFGVFLYCFSINNLFFINMSEIFIFT